MDNILDGVGEPLEEALKKCRENARVAYPETNRNFTIFTDASYCHRTRVAGYAFWARDSDNKYQNRFAQENVSNSVLAEANAIVWAINEIAQLTQLRDKLVIIVSDCKPAMQIFKTDKVLIDDHLSLSERMQKLKSHHGFDIKFNHVRAHSGTGVARNWVNDWCDRECKAAMRKLRAELEKNNA